ncbi:MAG: diguanylate cyclase [Thermoanaerobaculia bacterium]|nr:diguanylate cyclase [Thermoanaerobaculia bacterium]
MNLSRFTAGLRGRLLLAVGIPLLFAIGAGVALFFALRFAVSAQREVREADRRLALCEQLLLIVVDGESSQRGYALTGQLTYLTSFNDATESWFEVLQELRAALVDAPDQLARLERMDSLFSTWLTEVARPVISGRRELPLSHLEAIQALRAALFALLEENQEGGGRLKPAADDDEQRAHLEELRSQLAAAQTSLHEPRMTMLWSEAQRRLEVLERTLAAGDPAAARHAALRALLRQTNIAAAASRAHERATLLPLASGAGKELIDWIRKLEATVATQERQRLEERLEATARHGRIAGWLAVANVVLALGLGLATALAMAGRLVSSLRTVGRAAEKLAAGDLRQRVTEIEGEDLGRLARSFNQLADRVAARDREVALLHDMGQLLQAANDEEEAFGIVARLLPALVPGASGALYTTDRGTAEVVRRAVFGEPLRAGAERFDPGGCWGLRKGQTYLVLDPAASLVCAHLAAPPWPYVCMPLTAQGQNLGLLHLQTEPGDNGARLGAALGLLPAVASEVALALSNLALRAELLAKSVRDPLTALFNRRYLEETLTREIDRARRKGSALTVAMTDLDHFKRLNDTWGHEAGDQVLRHFAGLLRAHFRTQDVLCRYGGEEFALVFPDCSTDQAKSRAESLLAALRASAIAYGDEAITGVTASMGIAGYPRQGATPEVLLRQADHALYEAKRAGRDRVHVAPESKAAAAEDTDAGREGRV